MKNSFHLATFVLLLLAVAVAKDPLRADPPAPVASAPFALVVQETILEPVTPFEVADGYDTKVAVVLDHTGPAPAWWGQTTDGMGVGSYGDEALYYQDGSRRQRVRAASPWTAPFLWAPVWDTARRRFVAYYLVDLAHVPPHRGVVLLRGHVAVGMMQFRQGPLSPSVLVSVPLRRADQTVDVPRVSHDPMLTITGAEMIKYAPANTRFNGGGDTRVTVRFRYIGPPLPADPACSAGYPRLADRQGAEVRPSSISYGGLRDSARAGAAVPARGQQFELSYSLTTQPDFTKTDRLTLTDYATVNHGWPLSFQIVLHATGSPWSRPGRKPWISHPRILHAHGGR